MFSSALFFSPVFSCSFLSSDIFSRVLSLPLLFSPVLSCPLLFFRVFSCSLISPNLFLLLSRFPKASFVFTSLMFSCPLNRFPLSPSFCFSPCRPTRVHVYSIYSHACLVILYLSPSQNSISVSHTNNLSRLRGSGILLHVVNCDIKCSDKVRPL